MRFLKSLGNHLQAGIGYGILTAVYLTSFDLLRSLFSPYLSNSPDSVRGMHLHLEIASNFVVFVAIGFLSAILFSLLFRNFRDSTSRVRLVHLIPQFIIVQYLQLALLLRVYLFSDSGELRTWAALVGFFIIGTIYFVTGDYLARRVATRYRRLPTAVWLLFVCLLILLPVLLLSMERSQATQPIGPGNGPNLLLLTIDTLRFDHLSYNGYHRRTSPTIDSLSRHAFVFGNAYTPLPRTSPALASLLTGSYPHRHGVRSNLHHVLADTNSTLAEVLSKHGFTTGAFVHNPVLSPFRGLSQGFHDYSEIYGLAQQLQRIPALRLLKDLGLSLQRRRFLDWNAQLDTDLALRWLKDNSENRFFLWVHYLEPHTPYSPPPQYVDTYGGEYRGRYRWGFLFTMEEQRENTFGCKLPREEIRRVIDLYDSEINYVDDQIKRLTTYLSESGLDKNTIIVFTSDHGEGLGEHDYYFEHGDLLYDHNSKVPLFFILPGKGVGNRIDTPVSLNDVFPTVLELLGVDSEQDIDGISLVTHIMGEDTGSDRPLFAETGICYYPEKNDRIHIKVIHEAFSGMTPQEWFRNYDSLYIASKQRMALCWPWKLIYIPDGADGVCELYNLEEDPGESYNLVAAEPRLKERLKREVLAWLEEGEGFYSPIGTSIEGEVKAALQALGYIR